MPDLTEGEAIRLMGLRDRHMSGGLLAITQIRQLHSKRTFTNAYMAPYTQDVCAECRQVWPCATERVIEKCLAMAVVPDQGSTDA